MESLKEEVDFETEVDLAELKKGPPYVCSLLKKLLGNEKSNDSKLKSGKKYSFDISKFDQIFDVLLKDKQLILSEVDLRLLVYSGSEIVKSSKGVITYIDAILNGDIECRLEANMLLFEDEPEDTQEEEEDGEIFIRIRNLKLIPGRKQVRG
ncbi:hypothetical protein Ahy_B08g091646 [Arachis hypogaea]|uniref:Uncharacterized protein n=1 Tax=Arachis hypogaea TaxID=3818 RepID=A0A444Y2G2_ARAHY|nr:hypothetical protein Ahy_B08g091646 [Arachis hypogaea]